MGQMQVVQPLTWTTVQRKYQEVYDELMRAPDPLESIVQEAAKLKTKPTNEQFTGTRAALYIVLPLWDYPEHHQKLVALLVELGQLPFHYALSAIWQKNLERALPTAEKQQWLGQMAQLLYLRSLIEYQQGAFKQASETLHQALRLVKRQGNLIQIAQLYSQYWGALAYHARNFHHAYRQAKILEAALLKPGVNAPEEAIAYVCRSLAILERREGNPFQSVHTLKTAIRAAKQVPILLPETYRLRGLYRWVIEDYRGAIRDLHRARRLYDDQGADLGLSYTLGNLALVYWSVGRLSDAEALTERTIGQARQQLAPLQEISQIGNLGLFSLAQGRLIEARRRMRRHLNMAREYDIAYEVARAQGNIGVCLMSQGHLNAAYPLLRQDWKYEHETKRYEALCTASVNLVFCLLGLGYRSHAERVSRDVGSIVKRILPLPKFQIADLRAQAAIQPPEKAHDLLTHALTLTGDRPFDHAACLLELSVVATTRGSASALYQQGTDTLKKMGATAWLDTKAVQQRRLPVLI